MCGEQNRHINAHGMPITDAERNHFHIPVGLMGMDRQDTDHTPMRKNGFPVGEIPGKSKIEAMFLWRMTLPFSTENSVM